MQYGNVELISKRVLSTDWSLQPDSMKLESLVIAGQPYCGEYVLEFCTHRPSTQGSREYPTSAFIAAHGKFGDRE